MSDSDKESMAPSTSGNYNNSNTKAERLAKHLRRRYWTSWEEMRLVELWRRHCDDTKIITKSDPSHACISQDMRMQGFQVNSQECRRKMQQLTNKYNSERRLLEKSGDAAAKSEWKLYPLVDCILYPKSSHNDICHEKEIVKQLLDKLPPLPPSVAKQKQLKNSAKFDIKRAYTAKEHKLLNKAVIKIENECTLQPQPAIATIPIQQPPVKCENVLPQPATTSNDATASVVDSNNMRKRTHCDAASVATTTQPPPPPTNPSNPSKLTNGALDFRLHRFKIPRLEELRADNKRLAECRDIALRNLYAQEREVQMLQALVQSLQCTSGK